MSPRRGCHWLDGGDRLESMSGPEGVEGDMPEDNDSTYSGVGEGVGERKGYGDCESYSEGEGGVIVAGIVVAEGGGDNDGETHKDDDSSDST